MKNRGNHVAVAAGVLAALVARAGAVDLAITAEPYATGGLFTNPLIPAEP